MNILNYIGSLLPQFKKDRVMEEFEITISELTNVALTSFAEASRAEKTIKITSPEVKEFINIYTRIVKPSSQGMISSIHEKMTAIKQNLVTMQGSIEPVMQEDVVSQGLSVYKATILMTLETSYFISKYSVKLLNAIYILETAQRTDNKEKYLKESIAPAEMKYVKDRFAEFCFALNNLSVSSSRLTKILQTIPDVSISGQNAAAISSTLGEQKLNPLNLNVLSSGFVGNPIFHVRLLIAEWQANRYKKNAETKKVLELRLLNLKELNEGKQDAKIEQEIQYIQKRIEDIEYKMSKMEQE